MQPRGGVPRVKQVVRERDPVARGDGQDLVLDVAEEGDKGDARVGSHLRVVEDGGRVERPFSSLVPEDERAALVRSREDDLDQ